MHKDWYIVQLVSCMLGSCLAIKRGRTDGRTEGIPFFSRISYPSTVFRNFAEKKKKCSGHWYEVSPQYYSVRNQSIINRVTLFFTIILLFNSRILFLVEPSVFPLLHECRAPVLCEGQSSAHAFTYGVTCCLTHTFSSGC
jgi:hypothetical protein